MVTTGHQIFINQKRRNVYAIAEEYPLFVRDYEDSQILYSDKSRQKVLIKKRFYGLRFTWMGEAEKEKDTCIKWRQTVGLLQGLRATWTFKDYGSGATCVRIDLKFAIGIPFIGNVVEKIIVILFVKPTLLQILTELKKRAERRERSC